MMDEACGGTRAIAAVLVASLGMAQELPLVPGVELQPFAAATARLVEALEFLGAPLPSAEVGRIEAALADGGDSAAASVQRILDAHCVAGVHVNAESRVEVAAGPAPKQLLQHGWRVFLVKVHNEAGVTAVLAARSPNAASMHRGSTDDPEPEPATPASELAHRFLELHVFDGRPLEPRLSGLTLEYRILQLYSRDQGRREAALAFDVGQGTQDLGFRNAVAILFDCRPAVAVELEVLDAGGAPTTAWFVVRDRQGRVHPAPSRRLAPDFFFHPQVYRHSGETLLLPPGRFEVECGRGPEYVEQRREIEVPALPRHRETFRLERWIHVAAEGWRSGDHHIHAAGCAHYESPTQGVAPADMMRHVLGEDLDVGCVLSWGPCWYHQKQFFDGKAHALSTAGNLLRYDVEVSGFPSSHCGHLVLLRLAEDDYPGTTRIEQWPSWDLPVLQWAKSQGAVTGFAHSGWGLAADSDDLPNHAVPAFDGIGANEYVVDVVHGAVDFVSTVDTPAPWELNVWYHTLNCGFTTRISGETDFPCIYGERVGLGRTYVQLPPGPLQFDAWVHGLRDGRSYVSDGRSHLLDFAAGGVAVGAGGASRLDLQRKGTVRVTARVAARLPEQPAADLRGRPLSAKPYWHLERARLGDSRRVPVEVVVNGRAVARQEIDADGAIRPVAFDVPIERSSWIALRIYPSSHTNPVFVHVGGAPVRASRRSADWCLQAVEQCWRSKAGLITAAEREAARKAFDVAAAAYRRIRGECAVD